MVFQMTMKWWNVHAKMKLRTLFNLTLQFRDTQAEAQRGLESQVRVHHRAVKSMPQNL